jgi:hypothetical protein
MTVLPASLVAQLKQGVQLFWTGVFCYSTTSLLGLGLLNWYHGAECDKPLSFVLMGFGLLFLFGLILEIAGMKRLRPGSPMPVPIALGKMAFLVGCLVWTLVANIWTFSSVRCSNRIKWNGVGLRKGAIGITIWMNLFCLIVLVFLFFIVVGTCKGLVGYAYNEEDRPVYLPYLASYDTVSIYLDCYKPSPVDQNGSGANGGGGIQRGGGRRRPSLQQKNVYGVDATNEEKARFLDGGGGRPFHGEGEGGGEGEDIRSELLSERSGGAPYDANANDYDEESNGNRKLSSSYVDKYDDRVNRSSDSGGRLV